MGAVFYFILFYFILFYFLFVCLFVCLFAMAQDTMSHCVLGVGGQMTTCLVDS